MKNKNTVSRKVLFSGIFVFLMVLFVVGVLLKFKMNELFISYITDQITVQVELLAEVTEEKLNMEFKKMEGAAVFLNTGELEIEKVREIMITLEEEAEGAQLGLIKLNGNAIYGKQLNFSDFSGIQTAFRGNKAISYNKEKGLLFTLPIYRGDNIKYVLYKLYKLDLLQERFAVEYHDGEGEVQIINANHEVIVACEDETVDSLKFFYNEEHSSKEHEELHKQMEVSIAATVYSPNQKIFAFAAEIGNTEMRLTGTVPEKIATEGLFKIVVLVLWVFGLLLVLFIVGICYIVILDSKVQEKELLRLEKINAEKANKAKSNFLANMSHEIRTPINAIMGMNEMVLRECSDENIIEYSQNIQSASSNLLSIINDILDFSKIEAGKMEIVEVNYQLSSLLNDVVNMIQVKANQKNLKFEIDINENLPSILWGDEVRIRQVIVNILNNAVKYTKEGSVRFHVDGKIKGSILCLEVAVKDTGIGIKEEDKGKLFGHFERLDIEKNRNVEGTGLGLAITYNLVQQMHGKLQVESTYGVGSTFMIYLPQEIVNVEPIGNFQEKYHSYMKARKEYHEKFQAPNANILVVDDNSMNLLVVKNFLKKTMVQITTCQNGEDCLELMQQNKYHIVFLDHMMPGIDGIETLKRSKQMEHNASKDAVMIALTANAIVGVREIYLEEGFDDYLSKPVRGYELEAVLQKYLPKELIIPYHEKATSVSYENKRKKDISQVVGEEKKNIVINTVDDKENDKEVTSDAVNREKQNTIKDKEHLLKRELDKQVNLNEEEKTQIITEKKESVIEQQKALLETISREQLKEIVKELLEEIENEKVVQVKEIEPIQSIEIVEEKQIAIQSVKEDTRDEKEIIQKMEFPERNASVSNAIVHDTIRVESEKTTELEEIKKSQEVETEVGLLEKLTFLDAKTGLSYCCDSEEFYEEILQSYLQENHYKQICQFYETEDWKNYMIEVHALKSTSLSIGATELSKEAKALEFAVKEENIAYIHQNHEETMKHYNEILKQLSTIL